MNDEIIAEIKRRILVMMVDNPYLYLSRLQVQLETAALIGATVALELKDKEDALQQVAEMTAHEALNEQ